ncbi:hypothetical protein QEN19_000429 [Hanseniaspora menglaensis]
MISNILTTVLAASTLLHIASATTFNASSNDHLALYWGQNSAGSQERLSYYCEKQEADIIMLSFLYEFPSSIGLNFANACTSSFSDGLLDCDTIAEDIVTCQDLGVKVLLSLGGASGAYGFSNDSEATEFASTLWDYFGEGTTSERPFGDAVLDGFDFDIENNSDTGYSALVTELRSIFDKQGSKEYYISAAPQCVYPDAGVGNLLLNADVDFAFVQFYNNYCNLGTSSFNWDTWKDFAENDSYNKDIKIFLGLPGSSAAAGSGYQSDLSVVESAVSTMTESSHFGGIMLWDASQAYANTVNGSSYAADMKNIVDKYSSSSSEASTSSTISTSSTSTSSTISTSSTSTNTKSSSTLATTTFSSIATSFSTSTTAELSSTSTTEASSNFSSKQTKTTTTLAPTTSSSASSSKATSISASETLSRSTTTLAPSTTTSKNWNEPVTTETITLSNGNVVTTHIWWLPASNTITSSPTTATATTQTTTNSKIETPTSTSTTQKATSTVTDSALASAIALNKQYENGLSSSCTVGDMACDAEGNFALCGADGAWSIFTCSSGTTCFAYTQSDEIFINCNWSYEKPNFE